MAVLLRATQKVLRYLPSPSVAATADDTALGDWYATRVVVDRVPILITMSSKSLLAVVTRARELRTLPDRFPDLVRPRLRRLGVASEVADAECNAMIPVSVAKTSDRSVLGILVDFGKLMPHMLPVQWNEGDFIDIEAKLAGMPCHAGRGASGIVFPDQKTHSLLAERWGGQAVE